MNIFENDIVGEREFYENTFRLHCLENVMLPKYAKDRTYRDINLWDFLRDKVNDIKCRGAIMQHKNAIYLLDLSNDIKINIRYKFYNFVYTTSHRGKFFAYQSDFYKTRELMESETEVCELRRVKKEAGSFGEPYFKQNVTVVGDIIGEDIFGMPFSINNVALNLANVLIAKGMNEIIWSVESNGNYIPYMYPSRD